MLKRQILNKFVIKLEDVYKYAFCPARLVLERNSTYRNKYGFRKHYIQEKFEAYRHVFSVIVNYYELGGKDNNILYKLIRGAINKYKDILLPEENELASSIVTAYHVKMFEGLVKYIDSSEVNKLGTIYIPIDDTNVIDLYVDLSYTKKAPNGNTIVGYVILVREEEWNEIDLSNRFENTLLSQYITPTIDRCPETSTEIIYYNPNQAKVYKASKFSNTGWNISRLKEICTNIQDKKLTKQPLGLKCKVCPVKSLCLTSTVITKTRNKIGERLYTNSLPSSATLELQDEDDQT